MFCDRCGANNEEGARFCHSCGNRLSDGSQRPSSGPAWSSLDAPIPAPPVEEITPPLPTPPPVEPLLSEQMRLVTPPGRFPFRAILLAIVGLAAAGGIGAAVFLGATKVDWGFLPLVGEAEEQIVAGDDEGDGGGVDVTATATPAATATPRPILASVQRGCQDTAGQACQLRWNVVEVDQRPDLVSILYELEISGVQGCSVEVPGALDIHMQSLTAGQPGVYLEGTDGRYYPLVSSSRQTAVLECGATLEAAWGFLPPAGETVAKLRHPGLPPFSIGLASGAVAELPEDDPIAVVAAEAQSCVAAGSLPCTGRWEIGPFGVDADGLPVVFFAVRWDAEGGCSVQWISDDEFQAAAIERGEPGIRLEVAGAALPLAKTGGIASTSGPLDCGTEHFGWWKFEQGDLSQPAILFYPDIPQVQISLKP